MALGTDYARQDCSLARALELIGERWTMLILRDCFFGVRRFTDFQDHLDISKAVLTQRLSDLVDNGLLARSPERHGEYTLTDDALALWPAMFALMKWGEQLRSPNGPRRVFAHTECGSALDATGHCPVCGTAPRPAELEMRPGPGANTSIRTDRVSVALRRARPLLEPLRL